jgi:hypothetical protein
VEVHSWENHGKISWENPLGKIWENHRKPIGKIDGFHPLELEVYSLWLGKSSN